MCVDELEFVYIEKLYHAKGKAEPEGTAFLSDYKGEKQWKKRQDGLFRQLQAFTIVRLRMGRCTSVVRAAFSAMRTSRRLRETWLYLKQMGQAVIS